MHARVNRDKHCRSLFPLFNIAAPRERGLFIEYNDNQLKDYYTESLLCMAPKVPEKISVRVVLVVLEVEG